MPRVAENHVDFQLFITNFKSKLDVGFSILFQLAVKEKTTLEQSALTVHKACKIAIDNAHFYTSLRDVPVKNNQDEKKNYKGEVQNIDISKSSTNTSWYVPQAVMMDLISSQIK